MAAVRPALGSPRSPRMRKRRYSPRRRRPSSQTTTAATVSAPWMVETSTHSIRRGSATYNGQILVRADSGINSVALAQAGCQVTLVDDDPQRLAGVRRIWDELGLDVTLVDVSRGDWGALPFAERSFDLCWQWAGLWYLTDAESLLRELVRCARKVIFVAMPNRWQVGYFLRKHLIDREFFATVDERWTQMGRIRRALAAAGARVVAQGVLDVPPWPDTVMPAAEVLRRLGVRSARLEARFSGQRWTWSTMAYYLGQAPDLRARVLRYAWLDRAPLPWPLKAVWAHHRYLVAVPT